MSARPKRPSPAGKAAAGRASVVMAVASVEHVLRAWLLVASEPGPTAAPLDQRVQYSLGFLYGLLADLGPRLNTKKARTRQANAVALLGVADAALVVLGRQPGQAAEAMAGVRAAVALAADELAELDAELCAALGAGGRTDGGKS